MIRCSMPRLATLGPLPRLLWTWNRLTTMLSSLPRSAFAGPQSLPAYFPLLWGYACARPGFLRGSWRFPLYSPARLKVAWLSLRFPGLTPIDLYVFHNRNKLKKINGNVLLYPGNLQIYSLRFSHLLGYSNSGSDQAWSLTYLSWHDAILFGLFLGFPFRFMGLDMSTGSSAPRC